mgnify:CR=1 FL=1
MDTGTLGRGLIYIGAGLLDLGNLPGDLISEGETVRLYAPIGTMIVLSILLTLLLNVVLRLFR